MNVHPCSLWLEDQHAPLFHLCLKMQPPPESLIEDTNCSILNLARSLATTDKILAGTVAWWDPIFSTYWNPFLDNIIRRDPLREKAEGARTIERR